MKLLFYMYILKSNWAKNIKPPMDYGVWCISNNVYALFIG